MLMMARPLACNHWGYTILVLDSVQSAAFAQELPALSQDVFGVVVKGMQEGIVRSDSAFKRNQQVPFDAEFTPDSQLETYWL